MGRGCNTTKRLLPESHCHRVRLLLVVLATTLALTNAASSDETDLLARHAGASRGGRVTDVLVVTTTMRVLHGVHGATTHLGPAVALDTVLVVGTASLEHGLIGTTTTRHDTDGSTAGVLHPLLGARWKANLAAILVHMGDDGAVVAGATSHDTAVTGTNLEVGDDGTLRHLADREGVADDQLGPLPAVQELASVGALDSWHELLVDLVGAGIVEVHLGKGSTPARVVNDVLDDTLHEADALAIAEHTELGSTLAIASVELENRSTTLTLSSNNATHWKSWWWPLRSPCTLR